MNLRSAPPANRHHRNHSATALADNYQLRQNPGAGSQGSTAPSFVVKPYFYKKTVELAKEIPAARRVMNNLVGCLSVATRLISKGGNFNLEQLQESVDNMVDSVVRCPDAFTWLLRLRAKDPIPTTTVFAHRYGPHSLPDMWVSTWTR